MVTWKMYAITFVEILIFLAEKLLRNLYESAGIVYVGDVVWFGLCFFLFCLYSLFSFF
ncbi:hypothetical protein SAMN05216352_10258 [Alteribacillus bidgolensis]|uniref:Uncharacterized protein n=1 Tax=Alteribacillus bidgolensis TaxID=930129 RepID=A0A1G8E3T1_9BACI|nr:hypothetical protein SAMN05216352_10258 [Alteribacillus bidgolensis]